MVADCVAGSSAEGWKGARRGEDISEGGVKQGLGSDVAKVSVNRVADDVLVAASGVSEGGYAAGHGLEKGVGEPLVDGRDDEEIKRLVPRARIELKAGEVDAGGEGAGGGEAAGGLLKGAPGAGEEEGEAGVEGRELLEDADEVRMALEGAEASDETDEDGIQRKAGIAPRLIARSGVKAGGIDAIDDSGEAGGRKLMEYETLAEGLGNGVDTGGAPVENAAEEEAMGGKLRWGELGMLAMKDGCGQGGGERGVDERAEVVSVNYARGEAAKVAGERGNGAGGKAVFFAKDADIVRKGEALEELASASEAGDMDIEAGRGEGGGDVDDAILHTASTE